MELSEEQLRIVVLNATYQAISLAANNGTLKKFFEQVQISIRRAELLNHKNPLLRKGEKYYSQNEEDGILLEIIRRCGLAPGHFIEMGVGDGLENNSIILIASGWRGQWYGGQDLAFATTATTRLQFGKTWINAENGVELYRSAAAHQKIAEFDVFSIDLDGNDIHIAENIFEAGFRPKICICEYNAKFPPPIEFKLKYNPTHHWDGVTDYYGASIQSYAKLMSKFGFRLVACNITGSNAFFVRDEYMGKFSDIPPSIADLYSPPNDGVGYVFNNKPSPQTILSFINGEQDSGTSS